VPGATFCARSRRSGAVVAHWAAILELLFAAVRRIERSEGSDNDAVLPCVAMQQLCEFDKETAAQVKAHIFPSEVYGAMEGNKFDDNKFDPNKPLPEDASIRLHLIKLLTSTDYTIKRVVGDCLFAICAEDPREMVRLCGLGSSAGVMQEKGMLAQMQQAQIVGDL